MLVEPSCLSDNHLIIAMPKPDFPFHHRKEFSHLNFLCDDDDDDNDDLYEYEDAWVLRSPTDISKGKATATGGSSIDTATTVSSSSEGSSSPSGVSSFCSSLFEYDSLSDSIPSPRGSPRSNSSSERDPPTKGRIAFQVRAEYDLLFHVQKVLGSSRHRSSEALVANNDHEDNSRTNSSSGNKAVVSPSDITLSKRILRSIDDYCLQKQWMDHIGSEKAMAIGRFLKGGVQKYLKTNARCSSGEVKKFICVELGTYCGYSALVLASTLRQFLSTSLHPSSPSKKKPLFEFHIYTTEVSAELLDVARSVFRLAKMEEYITPILIDVDNDLDHHDDEAIETNNNDSFSFSFSNKKKLSQLLQEQHGIYNIDFLLLDHAKHLYLEDLQDLEDAKMLRAGSLVSADNVVFNGLDVYREHMHELELRGVVDSRLEEMNLEYINHLKDGMEMTVYLADPPMNVK